MIKQHSSIGIIILMILGGILFAIRDSELPVWIFAIIAITMVYISAKMLSIVRS